MLILFLEIFTLLIKLWQEYDIEISDFTDKRVRPCERMTEILKTLKSELKWKRSKNLLLKRIRKIGNNSDFSVRENKLLRKLVNQQLKNGYADFEAILVHFPGKTSEMLEQKYYEKINYLSKNANSQYYPY